MPYMEMGEKLLFFYIFWSTTSFKLNSPDVFPIICWNSEREKANYLECNLTLHLGFQRIFFSFGYEMGLKSTSLCPNTSLRSKNVKSSNYLLWKEKKSVVVCSELHSKQDKSADGFCSQHTDRLLWCTRFSTQTSRYQYTNLVHMY